MGEGRKAGKARRRDKESGLWFPLLVDHRVYTVWLKLSQT